MITPPFPYGEGGLGGLGYPSARRLGHREH